MAEAYEAVFGQEKKRSEAQKMVLADLMIGCDESINSSYRFEPGALDGIAIIAQGLHRDGAKAILRLINTRLSEAVTLRKTPKQPAVVKR